MIGPVQAFSQPDKFKSEHGGLVAAVNHRERDATMPNAATSSPALESLQIQYEECRELLKYVREQLREVVRKNYFWSNNGYVIASATLADVDKVRQTRARLERAEAMTALELSNLLSRIAIEKRTLGGS